MFHLFLLASVKQFGLQSVWTPCCRSVNDTTHQSSQKFTACNKIWSKVKHTILLWSEEDGDLYAALHPKCSLFLAHGRVSRTRHNQSSESILEMSCPLLPSGDSFFFPRVVKVCWWKLTTFQAPWQVKHPQYIGNFFFLFSFLQSLLRTFCEWWMSSTPSRLNVLPYYRWSNPKDLKTF